ncbi:MAG: helix-turn-helix domain-containing protein [Nocardioides sp.]|nr:helix-turn-helix domain-containing protein [Nocardioides sp.]
MSGQETIARVGPAPVSLSNLALVPATMDIAQAAEYLGIAKSTLYTWRTRRPGFGPRAVKAGGALRYRRSDLDAWIEAHTEELEPDLTPGGQESQRGKTAARTAAHSMSRKSRPRRR